MEDLNAIREEEKKNFLQLPCEEKLAQVKALTLQFPEQNKWWSI